MALLQRACILSVTENAILIERSHRFLCRVTYICKYVISYEMEKNFENENMRIIVTDPVYTSRCVCTRRTRVISPARTGSRASRRRRRPFTLGARRFVRVTAARAGHDFYARARATHFFFRHTSVATRRCRPRDNGTSP